MAYGIKASSCDPLTPILPGYFFVCLFCFVFILVIYLTGRVVVATYIVFYSKGPLVLFLVPMYRSWSLISISTKISTNNFHVTSLWRHTRQNGKTPKKMAKFVFDSKIRFSPSVWQKFIGKHKIKYIWDEQKGKTKQKKKQKQQTKNKNKNTKKTASVFQKNNPLCIPVFERLPYPREDGEYYFRYNERKGWENNIEIILE